ncbi:hypothetical protein XENOCAPTIV_013344 [Xenoophorus captivus]|uniref:Uncharacterized protein n=1 Tax=Xenoophorus captivus TaxID=1517983 RepID=A0ABV0QRN9_9TELE
MSSPSFSFGLQRFVLMCAVKGNLCVCESTGHGLWQGFCSRPNEKCCALLASLVMKLVIEMDEIMAPKAMQNKCASPNISVTGNGNKKEEELLSQSSLFTVYNL